MISIVHRDFHEDSSQPSLSFAATTDALTVPIHSWTYFDPTTRETAVVTLSAHRSTQLSAPNNNSSDGAGSTGGVGFQWELIYIPTDEPEVKLGDEAPLDTARTQAAFPHRSLVDLLVSHDNRRDGGAAAVEDTLLAMALERKGASASRSGGSSNSSSPPLVARECVVFLSARDVLVYAGKHHDRQHQQGIALERFSLVQGGGSGAARWRRQADAVTLPTPQAENGEEVDLLMVSSIAATPPPPPSGTAAAAAAASLMYLLTSSADGSSSYNMTMATLALSTPQSASSSSILSCSVTDSYTDRNVTLPSAAGGHALRPSQCHWRLLLGDSTRVVGILPMVKTHVKEERGAGGKKATKVVVTAYAVPRLLGPASTPGIPPASPAVAIALHRQRQRAGAGRGNGNDNGNSDDAAFEEDEEMEELLAADADELVERLTTDQVHVYCAPVGPAHAKVSSSSAATDATGQLVDHPVALEFVLGTEHGAAQGLHTTAPEVTPSWATLLDKRKRAVAAKGTAVLCVPQRYTVWADGQPVLLSADGAKSSPYEVLPTTALASGDYRGTQRGRRALCFPSTHSIHQELRLSYIYAANLNEEGMPKGSSGGGDGRGGSGLVCKPLPGNGTDALLDSSSDNIAEVVESLVASALASAEETDVEPSQVVVASAQAAALRMVSVLWRMALQKESPLAEDLLRTVQRDPPSSVGSTDVSFDRYAHSVWTSLSSSSSNNASPAAFAQFIFAAMRELLVQLDWLLVGSTNTASAFAEEMYCTVARLFLGGAAGSGSDNDNTEAVLSRDIRCCLLVTLRNAIPAGGEGERGRCAHWLRRMLLLHLCRRRHGTPLELLVQDVFAAAAAAPLSTSPTDVTSGDTSGMELALLQLQDDALLLSNMACLSGGGGGGATAVPHDKNARNGNAQQRGFLTLTDLCVLYGATGCTCPTHGEKPASPDVALLRYAAALGSSSPHSLSSAFAPLLLDLVAQLTTTASASPSAAESYRDVMGATVRRWQGIMAGVDGTEARETHLPPIALPSVLVRGLSWRQLTAFPWCAMPPVAVFDFFVLLTDSLVSWEERRGSTPGGCEDGEESGAWASYLGEHSALLHQHHGGVHTLRWLAGEDGERACAIAADLVTAMGPVVVTATASGASELAQALSLSNFNELLTSNSTSHLLLSSCSSAGSDDAAAFLAAVNGEEEGRALLTPSACVARVLHLCLANSTGHLLRRLVVAGGGGDGRRRRSSGGAMAPQQQHTQHTQHTQQDQYEKDEATAASPLESTLAVLYLSHAGAESRLLARKEATMPSSAAASRSISRRITPQPTPQQTPRHAVDRPSPPHPFAGAEEEREALRQLAVAAWVFPFQHDPAALANATLVEKLLDAFLWLNQRQEQQSKRPGSAQEAHPRIAETLLTFLRVLFFLVYPEQLHLLERELQLNHPLAHTEAQGSSSSSGGGGGGALPRRHAARGEMEEVDGRRSLCLRQCDTVHGFSTTARSMGAGELTEATRRTLGRLLNTFRDTSLPLRCLAALFGLLPTPADTAERFTRATRKRLATYYKEGTSAEFNTHKEDNSNNDEDGDGGNDGEGSGGGAWFCLSPPTAYFVATQITGTDVGRFALAGELLRRELRAYVLSTLFARGFFFFDRKRACLRGRGFDCRQLVNDLADECERCASALGSCAPLYEPLVTLLALDVLEEQVVANGVSREDGAANTEEKEGEEEEEDACSLYPAETIRAMKQCIAKAAQKLYAPLHADEKARVASLLRADFCAYLTPDAAAAAAAAASSVTLSYELSPIHQRMVHKVIPRIRETTEMLNRHASQARLQRQQPLPSHDPSSQPDQPDPFARERAAAAAVVEGISAGLRSALGVPPQPEQTQARKAERKGCPSAAATTQAESTGPPSLEVQLVVKEEAARRRQLESTLAAKYLAFIGSEPVDAALATVYLALRYEARRRDLATYVDEQRDIMSTFEAIYRRKAAQWREQEGHKVARAAAMRRAEAFEALWRGEDEGRAAVEAACYKERSVMWALASAQEECMMEEEEARRQWHAVEHESRITLALERDEASRDAKERQADREDDEMWQQMELQKEEEEEAQQRQQDGEQPRATHGYGAATGTKNAFQQWQEKQLSKLAEPEGKPITRPHKPIPEDTPRQAPPSPSHGPAAAQPHAPPASSMQQQQLAADTFASGLSRVVGAGEGLFSAFTLLQSKIRDTVAPAPGHHQPPQQTQPREPRAQHQDPATTTTAAAASAGAVAGKGEHEEGEDGWGWSDDEESDFVEIPPPPPTGKRATGAEGGEVVDEDWGWPEESEDAIANVPGKEHKVAEAEPRAGPQQLAAVAGTAGDVAAATTLGRKKKGKGLGTVQPIPCGKLMVTETAGRPAAADEDEGGDHDDGGREVPTTTAPTAAVPQKAAGNDTDSRDIAVQPLPPTQKAKKKRGGLLAAVPLTEGSEALSVPTSSPLPLQRQHQQHQQPSPVTPNPVRNIYGDIAQAYDEGTAAAAAAAEEEKVKLPEASGGFGKVSEAEEEDPFLVEAVEELEDAENVARQGVLLEEVRLYQHFKRSLILSYL